MNKNWTYIDKITSLPNCDQIHCDTRDFFILSLELESEESNDLEFYNKLEQFIQNNKTIVDKCSFKHSEILPLLKNLEIRSGGQGHWRHLAMTSMKMWWLKYIRFKKIDNDTYFCYTTQCDNIIPLEKDNMDPKFVNQEPDHQVLCGWGKYVW